MVPFHWCLVLVLVSSSFAAPSYNPSDKADGSQSAAEPEKLTDETPAINSKSSESVENISLPVTLKQQGSMAINESSESSEELAPSAMLRDAEPVEQDQERVADDTDGDVDIGGVYGDPSNGDERKGSESADAGSREEASAIEATSSVRKREASNNQPSAKNSGQDSSADANANSNSKATSRSNSFPDSTKPMARPDDMNGPESPSPTIPGGQFPPNSPDPGMGSSGGCSGQHQLNTFGQTNGDGGWQGLPPPNSFGANGPNWFTGGGWNQQGFVPPFIGRPGIFPWQPSGPNQGSGFTSWGGSPQGNNPASAPGSAMWSWQNPNSGAPTPGGPDASQNPASGSTPWPGTQGITPGLGSSPSTWNFQNSNNVQPTPGGNGLGPNSAPPDQGPAGKPMFVRRHGRSTLV